MLSLSLILMMVTSLFADKNCDWACLQVYEPICGSDGITHGNECEMSVAACTKKKTITKVNDGECSRNDQDLGCNMACIEAIQYVCASDGMTYDNECKMLFASCMQKKTITKIHNGVCHVKDCKKVCPRIFLPVCGSDGNTYSSKCELSVTSCKKNQTITKLYDGRCTLQEVNCKTACPKIMERMCGSDGKTYSSYCELLVASCLKQKAIIKVYDGECNNEGKCNIPCNRMLAPVCGSDGIVYSNECIMRTASCKQKKAITLIRSTDDESCSCLLECTKEYKPVCGSNRITYSSECVMRRYSCLTKKPIIVIRKGICKLPRATDDQDYFSSETEIL